MIADLNRVDVVRPGRTDLRFEIARSLVDLAKCPLSFAAGIENGGRFGLLSENRLPSFQQYVFRFRRLRKLPTRLHSGLLFDDESKHSPRISRNRYRLRMRRGLSHPLDAS